MSLENLTNQEGDLETEEEAIGTENPPTQENPLTQENLKAIDKDLKADKVDRVIIIGGPQMKTIIKNLTDQRMEEEQEGEEEEEEDTIPKRTEEVSMAMVAGVEKSARRP